MRSRGGVVLAALSLVVLAETPLLAQVTPEMQVAARGVVSVNYDDDDAGGSEAVSDFSDTAMLLGFRQKLFSDRRGRLVLGFQFPDAESELGQVFYHQVFIQVEDRTNVLKLGRSRVKSAMIEFPTLRDDDALGLTDVLNPFADGSNTEDSQFGNVVEAGHVFKQRYWLMLHGEHLTRSPTPPATAEEDFSLNAVGLWLEYRVPEPQRWNRDILSQFGIGANNFLLEKDDVPCGGERVATSLLMSTILNVRPDPVHFWDIRFQSIYNLGLEESDQLANSFDVARARSVAAFSSIRYLYRRLERPTAQVSLAAGAKEYPDLKTKTRQMQAVLTGLYRLGENFDLVAQAQYRRNQGELKSLYGHHEARAQLGFVYSLETLWNEQFDDRESLLNLEHGYIP